MKKLVDMTVTEFVAALASAEPTPGGGATAALVATLAASLGSMASGISLGKNESEEKTLELTKIKKNLDAIGSYLLRQIDEDVKSYQPIQKYSAMPKDTPDLASHFDAALRIACQVPTEILFAAAQAAKQLVSLADVCNTSLLSDIGVGLELCRAAMLASRFTIMTNAKGMKDEVFAMTLNRENAILFSEIDSVIDAGLKKVEASLA